MNSPTYYATRYPLRGKVEKRAFSSESEAEAWIYEGEDEEDRFTVQLGAKRQHLMMKYPERHYPHELGIIDTEPNL